MDICDFHSHILPNADHGSDSVEISLRQLALARKYGVTRIIATPHYYPHVDSVEEFIKRRNESYILLMNAVGNEEIPEIKLGAEVLLCPNMEKLPSLDQLCIEGTKTILLELPFNDFSHEYVTTVEAILGMGFNIVLAHAECYDPKNIEQFLALGVKIQINASALIPFFKNRTVEKWKKRFKVIALGSDIHGEDKHAYKNFSIARKKLGGYLEFLKERSDAIWNAVV